MGLTETKCPVCGEATSRIIKFGDKEMSIPRACKCARERIELEDLEASRQRIRMRDAEIIRSGYLDTAYLEHTFDKDDSPSSKPSLDLNRYVTKWNEMKQKNIGLLLMGSYGTGKTFYASAIANEVRKLGDYVLIGTLPKLIHEMNSNYSRDRDEIEEKIQNYPLMVIDDLGIERTTDYSLEQIESVIDLRYRAKKPLIVTTNLTKEDISNMSDVRQARIWSRLSEMCVPYAVIGADRRKDIGKQKREEASRLLGF